MKTLDEVATVQVKCFAPIADRNAEILILGSMPGRASLAAGQYYAHAQNAFWRIMSTLLKFDSEAPYAVRGQALKTARIALWDVLQSCSREGSLDSMIRHDTQVANDFDGFFRSHPKIRHVFFNGAKAEECYRRHVMSERERIAVSYTRLPSTSPAHASLSYIDKLHIWRIILDSR